MSGPRGTYPTIDGDIDNHERRIKYLERITNQGVSSGGGGGTTPTTTDSVFTQNTASATWTIPYSKEVPPAVAAEVGGQIVQPDETVNTTSKTITLTFGSPTTGRAFLT